MPRGRRLQRAAPLQGRARTESRSDTRFGEFPRLLCGLPADPAAATHGSNGCFFDSDEFAAADERCLFLAGKSQSDSEIERQLCYFNLFSQ